MKKINVEEFKQRHTSSKCHISNSPAKSKCPHNQLTGSIYFSFFHHTTLGLSAVCCNLQPAFNKVAPVGCINDVKAIPFRQYGRIGVFAFRRFKMEGLRESYSIVSGQENGKGCPLSPVVSHRIADDSQQAVLHQRRVDSAAVIGQHCGISLGPGEPVIR